MYDMVLSFITSFGLSYLAIPSIINVSRKKHLFDEPGPRTSHVVGIPNLGGLAVFGGMLFSIILWTPFKYFGDLQYILCAFIVLFLVGAKDDIDPVSPLIKLTAQLFAAGILVFKANVRITTLYSIFGVGELPYWLSIVLSVFVIIALINAFNLIDGIDGLAASISLLSSLVFGYWFFIVGRIELAIVAFALIGSVLAFLKFNYTPAKIFMGDTGSLLVGTVAAILAIQFIEQNKTMTDSTLYIPSAPALAIAILIVPLFDTARVITIRLLRGISPFRADRRHLHHLLLELGLTHMQSTGILLLVNLGFIGMAYGLEGLGNVELTLLMLGLAIGLSLILQYGVNSRRKVLLS
jgi:UDP-N-acetylmuramyl pentapeptide phosphotransferase/UDP-N-acetylglucosamine-1-phosphate transferase